MSERTADTITIGGGVRYAKVVSRLAEFHRDQEQCDIQTTCEFKDGFVMFSARVTTQKGTFTGHSMDKVTGRQKQFEKQETIAVGRALAFAGYLSSGDIACFEEMADVISDAKLNTLKLRFAKDHKAMLDGLDRPAKQRAFNEWALAIIGEQVDYQDHGSWCREWFDTCWNSLGGVAADVPFEE